MARGGYDYDLFVIGGGSGGVRAARIAGRHGARVALAEQDRIGGTCVIRGCVPKKLMAYAARYRDAFEDSVGFGWTPGEATFDWATYVAAQNREVERNSAAYRRGLDGSKVDVFASRAIIEDPHTIRLDSTGRRVTVANILVATGGHPNREPDIPGADLAITSDDIFRLEQLPERIVIVGAGFVAIEFASIMNGLGVQTTLIHRGPEILRPFDADVQTMMRTAMERRGITLRLNDRVDDILRKGRELTVRTTAGATISADQVLLAIGRTPNTTGFGLEEVGVTFDPAGAIMVDRYSRSTVETIYAIGDVTNRVNLTPVAIREGHAVADNLFGGKDVVVDHTDIPHAVFGTPEIGAVGLTEEVARLTYPDIDIYKALFTPMRNQISGRPEKMLMKLVVDGSNDRILGCHIVGPEAAELIQLVGVAVKLKATKADLDATMALHPTAAEELLTIREPSQRYRRATAAE